MTQLHRRRLGASLAALVVVTGLASGCTTGGWRYDVPPAAGVVEDAGPVKARNIMLVADDEGRGVMLGFLFSDEPVELVGAVVAGQQVDGEYGQPVAVDVSGEINAREPLELGGAESIVEGADLEAGLLAGVVLEFSDGTTLSVETPVVSADEPAYTAAWEQAQS